MWGKCKIENENNLEMFGIFIFFWFKKNLKKDIDFANSFKKLLSSYKFFYCFKNRIYFKKTRNNVYLLF